jgi:hypothetical protein
MPKFRVYKGHDAFTVYSRVVNAGDSEEAQQKAYALRRTDGWRDEEEAIEFDDVTILEDRTEAIDEDEPSPIILTGPERDIVMAALRLWQTVRDVAPAITDLARNGREHFLSDDEIDDLIEEKINV